MAGHDRILELPDEEFRRRVRLLESAFASLSAAFYFDGEGGNAIDVFDFFNEVDDVDDWVDLRAFAKDVEQLVLFAFEGAPNSIVRSWAEDHVEGSGDVGVERVQFMRDTLVTAHREWGARFSYLARTLGDLKTTHVFDDDLDEYKTVIRVDSFFTEGLRKVPSASSREYVTAALTRNELRRLIDKLRMADFRYGPHSDPEESDVEANPSSSEQDSDVNAPGNPSEGSDRRERGDTDGSE